MKFEAFLSSRRQKNIFFSALMLVFVFAPLLNEQKSILSWFHDHFFNTLVITKNFLTLGFPTFDGVTLTNDFSPLWSLVLAGLSFVFPMTSLSFLIAVRLVIGLGSLWSLFLLKRLVIALGYTSKPASFFLICGFQFALYFYIAMTGLEYSLVIPFVLFSALCGVKALQTPCFKNAFFYGCSVSLCAFVQFSSVLFFLTTVLVFYFQFNKKEPIPIKDSLRLLPPLCLGLLPLIVWGVFQKHLFGTFLSASLLSWSTVQELAPWKIFSLLLFEPIRYFRSSFANLALLMFSALLLPLVAHTSFPWKKREQTPQDTFFYALIWFPLLCFLLIAFMSYISLPEYVFYSLAVGAPFALLFATHKIDTQVSEKEKLQAQKVWLFLGFLFCMISLLIVMKPRYGLYEKLAQEVTSFTKQQDGVFAMSTGAGGAAFLSQKPFVRLDGLGENKEMNDFIDHQKELKTTFKTFNVDYYIAINPIKTETCFAIREPVQNRFGGTNKGMSDWWCHSPVFETHLTEQTKIVIFKITPES